MVSLMSDTRVVFLIWFVSIAIVVAGILIFIEIYLKKKKEHLVIKRREKTPVEKMMASLSREPDVAKKLDIVSKFVKIYFKEECSIPLKMDYSEMAKKFEKEKKDLEAEFCVGMFELYYSNKKLTEERVRDMARVFAEIYREKHSLKEVSVSSGFLSRIIRPIENVKNTLGEKINNYISYRRDMAERKIRIAKKEERELIAWVRKAISIGHDKSRVFALLSDGRRSKNEVEKILTIYDEEVAKTSGNKDSVQIHNNEQGVAQRIIQKEKTRFEDTEALGY